MRNRICKRVFDIVVTRARADLLAPLLMVVALAISSSARPRHHRCKFAMVAATAVQRLQVSQQCAPIYAITPATARRPPRRDRITASPVSSGDQHRRAAATDQRAARVT
jgi:hypothetical protein